MGVPWEFVTEEESLRALSGRTTEDAYRADRLARAQELLATLGLRRSHRVFEIGSGDGTVARELSPHCGTLDCCDISESFLRKARALCRPRHNVSFHRISSEGLSMLPSASYDAGFSLNVFIHFNPYQIAGYLRDVRRLLKPGGIFYFDACTLGPQTLDLFTEQLLLYQANPTSVTGLLNFNHPEVIRVIAENAGLTIDTTLLGTSEGWIRGIVRHP